MDFLENKLHGYVDKEVVNFLKFGWPVCADNSKVATGIPNNHNTAVQYPLQIEKWISKGLEDNTLLGPFPMTIEVMKGEAFSPLASREKSTREERRIIMDMSFPEGHSVNDAINKDIFLGSEVKLQYPKVDNLVNLVLKKGRGCALFKRDLKAAYRQLLRVDPGDVNLMGFTWKGNKYFDLTEPMGLRPSAFGCQRTTNAIVFIYEHMDENYELVNYLDDLASAELWSKAFKAFEDLGGLLVDCNIKESEEKAEGPNVMMTFLGIQFNTLELTLSITEDRLEELRMLLTDWLSRVSAKLKEFQSLVGKLAFAATVVRAARTFLCRLFAFMKVLSNKKLTKIPANVKKDLEWWLKFMKEYNGISMMLGKSVEEPDGTFASDACLVGCGAFQQSDKTYFHRPFPKFLVDQKRPIHQLEMITLVVAVKLWGENFAGKRISIYCDNDACVAVINNGKSQDTYLVECLRELLFFCAKYHFTINAIHIPGVDNRIPDYLSRWELAECYGKYFYQEVPDGRECQINDEMFEFSNNW